MLEHTCIVYMHIYCCKYVCLKMECVVSTVCIIIDRSCQLNELRSLLLHAADYIQLGGEKAYEIMQLKNNCKKCFRRLELASVEVQWLKKMMFLTYTLKMVEYNSAFSKFNHETSFILQRVC